MRESNSHQRFWRPLSYHLTNPLSLRRRIVPSKLHIKYIISYLFLQILFHPITFKNNFLCSIQTVLTFSLVKLLDLLVQISSICHHLHLLPIYLSSSRGLTNSCYGISHLEGASRLDAFSVYPVLILYLPCIWQCNRCTRGQSIPVLRTKGQLSRYPAPAPDRDRTVSRRSEPSSRTALMGEQPNPWNLLQLQDAMSRHRGAKPLRRCELLGVISLLSPG